MMNRDRKTIENSYYSTRELARLFQVDHTTVRRWADSGKLKCFKSPGGHRKFTAEHVVAFINTYHYEVLPPRLGFSPGPGKERLLSLIWSRDLHTLSEVLFAEARRAEIDNIQEILLNCYNADIPVVDIYDIIIRKTIRKIQSLQKDGKLSETDKHICQSSMVESLDHFQSVTQKRSANGRIAVCASPANGLEEILFLGANHVLRVAGWKVYYLGANTPINVYINAIEEYKPTLICASVMYLVGKEGQEDCTMLEKAAELNGTELLYLNLCTEEFDAAESISTGATRKIVSSLKGLVPYAKKPLPGIGVQKKNSKTTLTTPDAVESADAPNE
jgi:excisionase family DNA binding protein